MQQVDWHEHLNDIYSIANVSIEREEQIIVIEPHYLKRLVKLLDRTSPRAIGISNFRTVTLYGNCKILDNIEIHYS